MSKGFDLFSLNSKVDIHPRTWMCFNGHNLGEIFKRLEKEVLGSNNLKREGLAKLISGKYRCSRNTIKRILQRNINYYPLPVILEMLSMIKNQIYFKKEIHKNVELIKINSASARPVKAVKKLSHNLTKILGAFMADGSFNLQIIIAASKLKTLTSIKNTFNKLDIHYSFGAAPSRNQYYLSIQQNRNNAKKIEEQIINNLHNFKIQTHHNIELTEEYKDSVEAFNRWIKEEFGIDPTNFKNKNGAWRTIFSNKILARYLMTFFSVWPGPKTFEAFEPEIIQRSSLPMRKDFAKGVLMFDGCVTQNSKISFSTHSETLFNSIKNIWENDGVKHGNNFNKKRGENVLFTTSENKNSAYLDYFESNTQKWKLLHWLEGKTNYPPIIKEEGSLSAKKILRVLQKIKQCDTFYLQNQFNCSFPTVRTYLKILKNQALISLSNHPKRISEYVDRKATILLKERVHVFIFDKIKKQFGNFNNFANFIGIHKDTVSRWRLRKTKIPLHRLGDISSILNIEHATIFENVLETDREIAEII